MTEREKPSWRELDRKRDQSAHRRDESGPRGSAPRVATATAQYKRQLDALFDRGIVPDALKDKLPAPAESAEAADTTAETSESKARVKLVRAVRAAASGPELVKAIDALRASPGGLPEDPELLLRVLEHPSDAVLAETLTRLESHVDQGLPLPKAKRFVERLKGVEVSSFDPRVQSRAAALAKKVR